MSRHPVLLTLLLALGLAACRGAEPTLPPPEPLPPEAMPSPTARAPRPAPTETRAVPLLGTPPPVTLQLGDRAQPGALGTYCWSEPGEGGLCADAFGLPTPKQPLVTASPFTAQFLFDPALPPTSASLMVYRVGPEQLQQEAEDLYWWAFVDGPTFEVAAGPQADLDLDLEPGLYAFSLFLAWETRGDAVYGFLVQVD